MIVPDKVQHRCFTNRRRLTRDEIEEGIRLVDEMGYERPRTRGECLGLPRPCPFVGCRYHLYLYPTGVAGTSNLRINFPDRDPTELEHSCALDFADEGPHALERVGEVLNITRERVRQVQNVALRKLRWALYKSRDPHLVDALALWDAMEEWRSEREPLDEWGYWE